MPGIAGGRQGLVETEGLADFRRRLRALDRGLGKALRLALNESSQLVVDRAKPKVPVRSGKAAKSIRAASTQTTARARAGGARAPYYPWLDFGGAVGKNKSVKRQFRRYGRYIYPTFFRERDSGRFEDTLNGALQRVADQAGIKVKED